MSRKVYKGSNGNKNHNPSNCGGKWITRKRRFAIYERDDFRCAYCGAGMEEVDQAFTLDHIVPCELGGTNESKNLVSACKSCNSSKRDKSQRAFFSYLRDQGVDTDKIKNRIRRNTRRQLKGTFRL